MAISGGGSSRMFSITILILSSLLIVASLNLNTDDVADVSIGRNLLQAKQTCPVNMESLNYSNLTKSCRGPNFPPKECCNAFKILACPYAEYLNDFNTDCATTLFSYINLHGNYPPGLFASECKDSKRGLECPDDIPRKSVEAASGSFRVSHLDVPILLVMLLSLAFVRFLL